MPPRNESSLRVSNGKADVFQKTPTSHLISQLGITEQGSHFYPRFSLQIQKPHKWRELWARHWESSKQTPSTFWGVDCCSNWYRRIGTLRLSFASPLHSSPKFISMPLQHFPPSVLRTLPIKIPPIFFMPIQAVLSLCVLWWDYKLFCGLHHRTRFLPFPGGLPQWCGNWSIGPICPPVTLTAPWFPGGLVSISAS